MSPATTALTAAAGLTAGAFIVRPVVFAFTAEEGSRHTCPRCAAPLLGAGPAPYIDLALRRRCRSCPTPLAGSRLGPVALVPELLSVTVVSAVAIGGVGGWLLAAQLWIAVTGTAMVLIDTAVKRLPDQLTSAAALGVAVLLVAAAVTGRHWAAIHAVVLMTSRRAGRKDELAFGPALLVGALTVSVLAS